MMRNEDLLIILIVFILVFIFYKRVVLVPKVVVPPEVPGQTFFPTFDFQPTRF